MALYNAIKPAITTGLSGPNFRESSFPLCVKPHLGVAFAAVTN